MGVRFLAIRIADKDYVVGGSALLRDRTLYGFKASMKYVRGPTTSEHTY